MAQDEKNLIWIDCEMTGLSSEDDTLLEIAAIATDAHLNIIAESEAIAIYQPDEILAQMDDWNKQTHGNSGLIERVQNSDMSIADAEQAILKFVSQYVPEESSPMCGNSIHQDRFFLRRLMPELECYFHYRNLDVSTLKILMERWAFYMVGGFQKISQHQALQDIRDSIEELKYYRDNFLTYIPDPINR